jgi:hypothetical protein
MGDRLPASQYVPDHGALPAPVIVEGNNSVVLFDTSLRGQRAHGLNVVGYLPDGLVGELTVFFRPLAAMQLVAEVMGGHMAQRFGPPPEGLR